MEGGHTCGGFRTCKNNTSNTKLQETNFPEPYSKQENPRKEPNPHNPAPSDFPQKAREPLGSLQCTMI